jgi:hypothetical protein
LLRYVAFALLVAIPVAVAVISYRCPWIWYGSRNAYQWHRWLTFTMPADQVIYEEESARVARLLALASDPKGQYEGDVEEGPGDWPRTTVKDYWGRESIAMYWPPAFQVVVRQQSVSLVFMHGLVDSTGHHRFVVVQGKRVYVEYSSHPSSSSDRSAVRLSACSHQIGQRFRLFGETNGQSSVRSVEIPLRPDQVMRIYAGQPDPNDDAHFTIKYEIDNIPGTIDGRLEADDTVTLKVIDGPAATRPTAQPATAPAARP